MDTDSLSASPVALFICLLTIATSLYTLYVNHDLFRMFLLHPYSLVRQKRYYTALSHGLIHGDMAHLIFNMLSFYFFAFPLEPRIGHWQFLLLYVVSLALSDATTIIKRRNDPSYTCLGASGAVTAVIFSYIIYDPGCRIYFMFIPIGVPGPLYAVLYIALSYYAARNQQGHINHEAHLWGGISGLLITLALDPGAYGRFFDIVREMIR